MTGFHFALVVGIPGEALPEPDAEDWDVRATAFCERFSRERHMITEQVPDVPERGGCRYEECSGSRDVMS